MPRLHRSYWLTKAVCLRYLSTTIYFQIPLAPPSEDAFKITCSCSFWSVAQPPRETHRRRKSNPTGRAMMERTSRHRHSVRIQKVTFPKTKKQMPDRQPLPRTNTVQRSLYGSGRHHCPSRGLGSFGRSDSRRKQTLAPSTVCPRTSKRSRLGPLGG